ESADEAGEPAQLELANEATKRHGVLGSAIRVPTTSRARMSRVASAHGPRSSPMRARRPLAAASTMRCGALPRRCALPALAVAFACRVRSACAVAAGRALVLSVAFRRRELPAERRLERRHQIRDLRFLGRRLGHRDLAGLRLLRDQLADAALDLVLVLRRIEVRVL